MAFVGDAAVVLEAEEVIRKWLSGVEDAAGNIDSCPEGYESSHRHHHFSPPSHKHLPHSPPPHIHLPPSPPPPAAQREEPDYLGSLDWDHGNIADSARNVVEGLLRKDLPGTSHLTGHAHSRSSKVSHDPLIGMEMRHQRVKERRKLRDERQRQRKESELLLKQAQREAEAVVKQEERKAKQKAAREEKLFQQQVSLMRSQLRQQRESDRHLATQQRALIERELTNTSNNRPAKKLTTASPVIVKAEEIIVSEKKRQRTRSELIRQLEEAKALEAKDNIRLLHRSFSVWYEAVVERRARLGKVLAVRQWRLLVRVWGGWRRHVLERRARREQDMATREMQRMKRVHDVAVEHYQHTLLSRVLAAWQTLTRVARADREQQQAQELHRRKMDALLRVAAGKVEEHRVDSPLQDQTPPQQSTNPVGGKPHPSSYKAPVTSEPAVWQAAKQQLSKLMQEVEKIATEVSAAQSPYREGGVVTPGLKTTPTTPGAVSQIVARGGGNNTDPGLMRGSPHPTLQPVSHVRADRTQIKRPKPKSATKPLPMTGMASRSAAILERRAARERRREAMLKEKEEKLAQEEAAKRKAEQEAKEALLQKKREERRLAKQKEMEKLKRQQHEAEQMKKATSHSHTTLLRHKGLAPWLRFVKLCRANGTSADQLRARLLQRRVFGAWYRQWCEVETRKCQRALALWERILVRRSWRAWLKCVERGRELEALAEQKCPRLLVHCVFRGWYRVSKEERMSHWEKMARARRFRQRYLLGQVLKVWSRYVPEAKQERAKESRRAELRRKVSSWLTDFQPQPMTSS